MHLACFELDLGIYQLPWILCTEYQIVSQNMPNRFAETLLGVFNSPPFKQELSEALMLTLLHDGSAKVTKIY